MSFCTLVFPKFYVVPLRFLKFYFLPWRFRNFRLYPLVFEILSHALHILKFFTMPSLFRFYVCSIFFLCPFFSFFSLLLLSLFQFCCDRNDDLFSCSSFSPCLCRFLLLLLLPSFVLVVSLHGSHLCVSSFCWCLDVMSFLVLLLLFFIVLLLLTPCCLLILFFSFALFGRLSLSLHSPLTLDFPAVS